MGKITILYILIFLLLHSRREDKFSEPNGRKCYLNLWVLYRGGSILRILLELLTFCDRSFICVKIKYVFWKLCYIQFTHQIVLVCVAFNELLFSNTVLFIESRHLAQHAFSLAASRGQLKAVEVHIVTVSLLSLNHNCIIFQVKTLCYCS
jgi:hypothetical protein